MLIYLLYFILFVVYLATLLFIGRILVMAKSFRSDALYVPVKAQKADLALQYLDIQPGENIVDLGSGDGKFIFIAAQRHPESNFVGVESNYLLYLWSKFVARVRGFRNVTLLHGDVKDWDFHNYDKVYLHLTDDLIEKIIMRIDEDLAVGAVVVSVDFGFGGYFSSLHNVKIHKYPEFSAKIYQYIKQ